MGEKTVEALSETEERDSLPRVIYFLAVLILFEKSSFYADIMIDVQTRNDSIAIVHPFKTSPVMCARS
jgi:hypothetical protein